MIQIKNFEDFPSSRFFISTGKSKYTPLLAEDTGLIIHRSK
jgi:hypothetical protein